MSTRKLKDLPANPARDLLSEAEQKGIAALGGSSCGLDAASVLLFGFAEIIRELREEIRSTKP